MLIYASYAPGRLPEPFRSWLNPDIALPLQVEYKKVDEDTFVLTLLKCVFAIPVFAALYTTAQDIMSSQFISLSWTSLGGAFIFPLALTWWAKKRSGKVQEQVQKDEIRLGLFLHPEALLIRLSESACSLIPCQYIAGFEMVQTRGSRCDIRVNYRVATAGGNVKINHITIKCSSLEGYAGRENKLLGELNQLITPGRSEENAFQKNQPRPDEKRKNIIPISMNETEKNSRKVNTARGWRIAPARWESLNPQGGNHFCEVFPNTVNCWENRGTYSQPGGSVTHEAFIRGEYQDYIRSHMGEEVFRQVMETVAFYSPHLTNQQLAR